MKFVPVFWTTFQNLRTILTKVMAASRKQMCCNAPRKFGETFNIAHHYLNFFRDLKQKIWKLLFEFSQNQTLSNCKHFWRTNLIDFRYPLTPNGGADQGFFLPPWLHHRLFQVVPSSFVDVSKVLKNAGDI